MPTRWPSEPSDDRRTGPVASKSTGPWLYDWGRGGPEELTLAPLEAPTGALPGTHRARGLNEIALGRGGEVAQVFGHHIVFNSVVSLSTGI